MFLLLACMQQAATPESRIAPAPAPAPASAPAPLMHDAFVWQRVWRADTLAALQQPGVQISGVVALVAEVERPGGAPALRQTGADLAMLAGLAADGHPVGLAIRVGVPGGAADAAVQQSIRRAALEAVASARARAAAAGLTPAELHLDIDMPTARLADYAAWLPEVRAAWPGMPLTITGLPDWLRPEARAGLAALLAQVDGWVLQVHWLRPVQATGGAAGGAAGGYALMEPGEVDLAVARASAMGRPFRVALPTYTQRGVRADPAMLAGLVARWTAAPVPWMRGVIWFRLPVPGEADTLPVAAWAAAMAGRAPVRSVRAEAVRAEAAGAGSAGQVWDIFVENDGEDESGYTCVAVTWEGRAPEAVDALMGAASAAPGRVRMGSGGAMRPGMRRTAGWVRLAAGEVVDGVAVVDAGECGQIAAVQHRVVLH